MTNLAMWGLIVGFLSPLVLQFLTGVSKDSRVQAAIAFVWSAVVAIPTVYFGGNLDNVHSYVSVALIILVATISSYKGFWKPAGVTPSTTTIRRGDTPAV